MSQELSNDGIQTGAGSSGFGFPGNIATAPAYSPYMVPLFSLQLILDAYPITFFSNLSVIFVLVDFKYSFTGRILAACK